jgi:hypothetical protein
MCRAVVLELKADSALAEILLRAPGRALMTVRPTICPGDDPRRLPLIADDRVLDRDRRLIVTMPETVEATAEEPAPALQAA